MKSIKKTSLCILFLGLGLIFSMPSNAGFQGPDTTPTYNNVKAVLDNPKDDMRVTLQGNIIKKTGHERYIFQDQTGQITIELDDKKIIGIDFNEKTLVEINGEIEYKQFPYKKLEIDVAFMRTLN